ncbi:MAG: hypothetical protein K2G24_08560 [Muribaculaceae bacterium]|nr:hypothetical protein [Muribaculaceae bacterium]
MKKATLLACAALVAGQAMMAQSNSNEVTYVEDASQGLLVNSFKSNWFITGQGGVSYYLSHADVHRKWSDRFAPAAGLYVGKWFTPVFGGRVGGEFLACKGLSDFDYTMGAIPNQTVDGYYKTYVNEVGVTFDLMVNLTNWWCGYNPNRVYNATFYVGGGGYWSLAHRYTQQANGSYEKDGWHNDHDRVLTIRAGLINSFRLNKHLQLNLDLRFSGIDGHYDQAETQNRTYGSLQAYLGLTYNFNPTGWSAPLVPVCPEPENCDELRARLAGAEGRIADLEQQLRDCLNRPVEKVEAEKAPLATIYYPIGVSRLTREDRNVLGAISEVMKSNSKTNYVLTGWADNYTGTEQINVRLRKARVDGVYKALLKNGVPASQLTATTNNGNLCDLGEKYVALDRAVTIEEAE